MTYEMEDSQSSFILIPPTCRADLLETLLPGSNTSYIGHGILEIPDERYRFSCFPVDQNALLSFQDTLVSKQQYMIGYMYMSTNF